MAPSSVFKSLKPARWPLAAAVAALVFTLGLAVPTGPAVGQSGGIDRGVIPMAPNAPERYVVQKGDTLWDISGRFLRDPWYWPEIWYVNPQVANPHLIYPGDVLVLTWVDGQPRVMLERGGATRLSPRVREKPLSEAIRAIPWEIVEAYMSKPTVLAKEQIESAPYVVTARDERRITSSGDKVYARRLTDASAGQSWMIYHVGSELKDPETGDHIGYEGVYTATGRVLEMGDPSTLLLTRSTRETQHGDILLPDKIEIGLDIIPRAPPSPVEGVIMAVTDKQQVFGEFQVAVINRGTRDGMEPGYVLAVWDLPREVRDETPNRESSSVTLPSHDVGKFVVFKTWDRISYGLVLDSTREMQVGFKVKNP
jgi:hypothetical protein